jgi:hypothetical protein
VDNFEFGKSATGREAERERGGGCIIRVLENEIDLHLQIVTKAVMNPQLAMPLILTRIAYNRLLWRFLIYP